MTLLLKQIFGLFKLLNSETGTVSIAAGVALGFVLGMSPILSLQAFLVFVVMFFLRVQIGAAFLSAAFFGFVAWAIDPVADSLGASVLATPALEGVFTSMYNMPLVPLTRFNNTVVMGSGLLAVALSPVVFLAAKALVEKYRQQVLARFKTTKAFKTLTMTKFYKWYVKYDELFG